MRIKENLPPALHQHFMQHRKEIAAAVLAGFDGMRKDASLTELVAAVERGDVSAAYEAVRLRDEYFDLLHDAIRASFVAAGRKLVEKVPASALAIRFEGKHPRAETWATTQSSERITRIIEGQRETIRAHILDGLSQGRNPYSTALEIVGRVNPISKRREGGVIGLTERQRQYVTRAISQLASGDPAEMSRYFQRQLRDRRFDSVVKRAMKEGRPVAAADRAKIAARYHDRLLKHRGDTIARTESIASLSAGRSEGVRQIIDKGQVPADKVEKTWRATGGSRTRDTHAAMNGQTKPVHEPFVSPSGARLMHPCDGSYGAGASEIANCRCYVQYRIDFLGMIRD